MVFNRLNSKYQFNVSIVILVFISELALAHKPVFRSETGMDPNSAIPFLDPDISQVVYRELPKGGQVWTTFTAPSDFELYVQIGIPVLERQKEFRPSLVIVGQDLAEPNVPFAIPEGLGAFRIDTRSSEVRFFHEPFTGTDSWILATQTVKLPDNGRFYIVAFDQKEEGGKLWIAVGTKERFGLFDIFKLGKIKKWVREFHEVKGIFQKSVQVNPGNNSPKN
jgi:hypothetical protein